MMKLEVINRNGHYYWILYDGPDGIDTKEGYADSLGQVFEQVIQTRYKIGLGYYDESN